MLEVIILFGAPGCGKGTQAKLMLQSPNLNQKYTKVYHLSLGDALRTESKSGSELGNRILQSINSGNLLDSGIVKEVLLKNLQPGLCILDGFPRKVEQVEILDSILDAFRLSVANNFKEISHKLNIGILKVINLHMDLDLLLERLSGRLSCVQCGSSFHKKFNKPSQEGVCDNCKGTLTQRADDANVEILQNRLRVYREETAPLIEIYQGRENLLTTIDANKHRDLILQEIINLVL